MKPTERADQPCELVQKLALGEACFDRSSGKKMFRKDIPIEEFEKFSADAAVDVAKYYFEKPLGSPYWGYLTEIDRVCEIIKCGVVTWGGINCFDVKLKITKSPIEFLIIDLRYPLEDLIEYEEL